MASDELRGEGQRTRRLDMLSHEEMMALQRACDNAREWALVGLLQGGLRPHEVCALRVGDLCGDTLLVWGKDGRKRMVPLGPELSHALRRCAPLAYEAPAAGEQLLFAADGRLLHVRTIGEVVRAAARRAGLAERLSPHALRARALRLRWRQLKTGGRSGIEGETR